MPTYLGLGIEHILLGIDHLLFVLGLMLLIAPISRARQGDHRLHARAQHHAGRGHARLRSYAAGRRSRRRSRSRSCSSPLEIVHARAGQVGIAARAPWLVAFAFGLLHGFGFAGALSEVGMPAGHIPVALLFFNLGVEVGQLLFVAAVLGLDASVAVDARAAGRAGHAGAALCDRHHGDVLGDPAVRRSEIREETICGTRLDSHCGEALLAAGDGACRHWPRSRS